MAIWRAAVIGVTGTALAVMLGLGARGAAAQCIGDGNGDNKVTIDELVKAVDRALDGCQEDDICSMSCPAGEVLGPCAISLIAQCRNELHDCRAQPGRQRFPASGQMTSYGPGSDGDVQAGATLSYTDNGDGTITDNNTGLMWEKKDDSRRIHDQDNTYTWWDGVTPGSPMNGTMVTVFLATLNTPPCFAGHCDWRIPNVKELQSIVDYENFGPAVNAAFHDAQGCPRCTNVTLASCSCTNLGGYWSATTYFGKSGSAWGVSFVSGGLFEAVESAGSLVRAVRGGL
jgi:hypothetical protein